MLEAARLPRFLTTCKPPVHATENALFDRLYTSDIIRVQVALLMCSSYRTELEAADSM